MTDMDDDKDRFRLSYTLPDGTSMEKKKEIKKLIDELVDRCVRILSER